MAARSRCANFKTAQKRMFKEYNDIIKEHPPGISIAVDQADPMKWEVLFSGLDDTIFDGGIYRLQVHFGDDYPYKAPNFQFNPAIYHCNVYDTGKICLDVIQDKYDPGFSIKMLVFAIQELLNDPNPASPANAAAANAISTDKSEYERIIRQEVEASWSRFH